jgi:peptide/nickel transport system substrate-binding protein
MKFSRIIRAVAIAAVGVLGTSGLAVAPAGAADRTLVRIAESNVRTSLNSSHSDHNLVENGTVAYLTGDGFNYYNNKSQLVKKTGFGTYRIVKQKPLTIETKINKGLVWSDGTQIDAYDLLEGWVTDSGHFDNEARGVYWDSVGKGGGMQKITKFPAISADSLTATWTFDEFDSSWELFFGIGRPVHALTQLAYPTLSDGQAKARFVNAVKKKDWTVLKALADQWNTAYNFIDTKPIDATTNPNLLITAGAYTIKSSVPGKSMTLVANPLYKSGPKPTIKTIQLVTIPDSTAMGQALANGEVDIIAPQATAALVNSLKAQPNTTVYGFGAATYEHLDVDLKGPAWAGMSAAKANDLRRALLLTIPRQEIVDKLVKTINPAAKVLNSITPYFNADPNHAKMSATSGVKPYTDAEATRLAAAKALLAKHGYSTTNPLKLTLHWGGPTNERRKNTAALIVAAAAKVGIEVNSKPSAVWSQELGNNKSDLQFFAWAQTSTVFTGLRTIYGIADDGTTPRNSNYIDWLNPTVDKALARHSDEILDANGAFKVNQTFEKEYFKDAVGLPLFQWASIAAATKTLKNVKPSALSPQIVWNYWEWKY